jgi:diacylglycerol kinase (ATP)
MTVPDPINRLQAGTGSIGIIFNPFSGKNRKNIDGIRKHLQDIPGADFREVRELKQMNVALNALHSKPLDLLVIAGGDGMVQEVIRYLLDNHPRERWPLLSIIPGGTTNMTASDLGISGNPADHIARLQQFLNQDAFCTLVERPALRVEHPGYAVNYGMFFGAGLIARGVKYSRSKIKKIGVTGGIFSAIIALRCLAGFIFGKGKGDWQPAALTIRWPDNSESSGQFLFAFASTLNTLLFDSTPYWGAEQAPVHVTMVRQHPGFSWWSFLRILKGKGSEIRQPEIYSSTNCQTFELEMIDEYIIDGELYNTDVDARVLRISVTEALTFLTL